MSEEEILAKRDVQHESCVKSSKTTGRLATLALAFKNAGDFELLTEEMQALYRTLLGREMSGHEDEFEAKLTNLLNDRVIGGETTG